MDDETAGCQDVGSSWGGRIQVCLYYNAHYHDARGYWRFKGGIIGGGEKELSKHTTREEKGFFFHPVSRLGGKAERG